MELNLSVMMCVGLPCRRAQTPTILLLRISELHFRPNNVVHFTGEGDDSEAEAAAVAESKLKPKSMKKGIVLCCLIWHTGLVSLCRRAWYRECHELFETQRRTKGRTQMSRKNRSARAPSFSVVTELKRYYVLKSGARVYFGS